jgi:phosphatidylglycerophosphate synthase
MSFGARLRWPGETQLGKILDPIADKGTFYSVLLPGGLNFLPGWLVYINFLLAIALTVSRPVLRFLYQAEVAANWFGKRKIWFEVLTISSLALLPRDRIGFYCGTAMLAIATALAALSLAAQLWRALRPSSSS